MKATQWDTAMRHLRLADENLTMMSTDTARYTDERSLEILRRAAHVVRNLKAALEGGRTFKNKTTSAAQEFDHVLSQES